MANTNINTNPYLTYKFDLDSDQVYKTDTGETVGEIENLTEKQLKEILEIKKELQEQP